MNIKEKELVELLEQLDLDEKRAKQTLEDIQRVDELLEQYDQIEVDPVILDRVEAQLLRAPISPSHTESSWWRQVAVMAAALLMVLGVTILIRPQSQTSTVLDDELDGYWQQALVMENETKRDVDGMILSEVLQCWSEAEWEVSEILGAEDDGQQNPLQIGRSDWIGHQLCE